MTAAYRRVHRLSPLLRVWAGVLALLAITVFNFIGPLYAWLSRESVSWVAAAWALGAIVVTLVVALAASQLWWARIGFRLDSDELVATRGLLNTRIRTARYDRIQAVDVIEPLAARVFGLAAVRVEVAGGANSAIEIAYLPREEAEELRAEILRAAAAPDAAAARAAYLVAPIPIARSLAAAALQLSTLVSVVFAAAPLITGVTVAAVVPVLIGLLPQVWRTVDQSWRFSATHDDGGVFHVAYGLANRRQQAIPQSRIHAVQLKQPWLWRPFGWWTVSVTVAGYGSENAKATGTSKLLPVGTWAQAREVLNAIGVLDISTLTAPDHAAPAVVEFYASPPRARWVSPVDWRQQWAAIAAIAGGAGGTGAVVAVASGRFTRRYRAIETSHIQELTYRQGPLQRALGLASIRLDLVPGAVKMAVRDVDEGVGLAVVDKLRARQLPPN